MELLLFMTVFVQLDLGPVFFQILFLVAQQWSVFHVGSMLRPLLAWSLLHRGSVYAWRAVMASHHQLRMWLAVLYALQTLRHSRTPLPWPAVIVLLELQEVQT